MSSLKLNKTLASMFLDVCYPIGSIYLSVSENSPQSIYGGIWEQIAKGRTLVGVDKNDNDFNVSKKIGGEKTHKLTVAEMPKHSHKQKAHNWETTSAYATGIRANEGDYDDDTSESGGDQPHNNLQPYFTCYIWCRIA